MFEIFMYTVNAVLPILLLVALGYGLKKVKIVPDHFYKQLNKVTFHVFLPVLLFHNIYKIESLQDINAQGLLWCLCGIVLLVAAGLLILPFIPQRNQRGVLIQCSFRSNYAIVGIPLAAALGGEKAVAFASVVSAFSIPIYNALAVIFLTIYSDDKKSVHFRSLLTDILKNPLIQGVAAGVAVLLFRAVVPSGAFWLKNTLPFVTDTLGDIAVIGSPLALIVLGAQFDFQAVRRLWKQITLGVTMRLIVSPMIGILGAVACNALGIFHLTSTEYPAFIALFATPVAVSSAVMASEIGGDDRLAGQLVVWTSLFSMVSLFVIIFTLRSTGIL